MDRLDPLQRARDLDRMRTETFDVVVIGGGVTGAGVALDAATRGLSVALVEQRDFAAGTSSRSSKLFHGGLRYLEQFEFGLVTEALHERNLMLRRLCPHLARPVSFLYPLDAPLLGTGLRRRRDRPLRRARRLRVEPAPPPPPPRRVAACAPWCPSLRTGSYIGGIRYWDAQVDDARHTDERGPDRRALRRRHRVVSVRVVGHATGRPTGRRCRGARRRVGRRVHHLDPPGRQRHRRVDRPHPGHGRRRIAAGPGVEGRAPRRPPRPDPVRLRSHLPDAHLGPVRHPVGFALARRHHRHRLEPRPRPPGGQRGRPRLPARPGEPAPRAGADPRRHRRRVRRAPAAAVRRVGFDVEAQPRARSEHRGTGSHHRRRRQVHDLPRDGRRRRRRRRRPRSAAAGPVVHRSRSRSSEPSAGRRSRTDATSWRRRPGLSVQRIDHLIGRYGAETPSLLDAARRRTPPWPSRCPAPTTTSAWRSASPRRTRAPCTSTTCSPAALASRSRPPTAGWPPPRSPPRSWARCSGGTRRPPAREVDNYRSRVEAERDSQAADDDRTADARRLGADDVRAGRRLIPLRRVGSAGERDDGRTLGAVASDAGLELDVVDRPDHRARRPHDRRPRGRARASSVPGRGAGR